jgi:hypothetical protein
MPLILNFTMPPLNLGDSLGYGAVMNQDQNNADGVIPAANDNGDGVKTARIDDAVLRIARLIGRQMAREQFEHSSPSNDNSPPKRQHD